MNPDDLFSQIWSSQIADASIHPDDEMFLHLVQALGRDPVVAHGEYLLTGAEISALLTQTIEWLDIDLSRSGRMLDYAAGYGRSTRHLIKNIPAERIWVSDIQTAALEHQRNYGVHGMRAAARPADLEFPGGFDFVSVISLLTHVPRHTFGDWLRALLGLLTPGGALLFTTHDLELSESKGDEDGDYTFAPYDEQRFETPDGYGNTYVSSGFVQEQVAAAGGRILAALPKALTGYQDVFVVSVDRSSPAQALRLRERPRVVVDVCRRAADGQIEVGGWAACEARPLSSVELYGDASKIGSAELDYDRPDLIAALGREEARHCGWVFRTSQCDVDPTILSAAAYTDRGEIASQSLKFASGGHTAADSSAGHL